SGFFSMNTGTIPPPKPPSAGSVMRIGTGTKAPASMMASLMSNLPSSESRIDGRSFFFFSSTAASCADALPPISSAPIVIQRHAVIVRALYSARRRDSPAIAGRDAPHGARHGRLPVDRAARGVARLGLRHLRCAAVQLRGAELRADAAGHPARHARGARRVSLL